MEIGTVLKKIRMIYSYSATELSKELNISKSYLSEIENNKKQPSLSLLEDYSETFNLNVSSILLLSEEYKKNTNLNKSDLFIQKQMLKLINKFSSTDED